MHCWNTIFWMKWLRYCQFKVLVPIFSSLFKGMSVYSMTADLAIYGVYNNFVQGPKGFIQE